MALRDLMSNPLHNWVEGDVIKFDFSFEREDYREMSEIWQTCRDAVDGQSAIKKAGARYLPKMTGQEPQDYKNYLQRALYYNATGRTVTSYEGMIDRKEPVITLKGKNNEATTEINPVDYYKRITNEGKSLHGLIQDVVHEVITQNRVGVLVDFPSETTIGNISMATKLDKERSGLKPILTSYVATSIINWQFTYVGDTPVPVMYVLRETVSDYGENSIFPQETNIYRILALEPVEDPETGEVHGVYKQVVAKEGTHTKKGGTPYASLDIVEVSYPMKDGQLLDFIPFYIVTDKGIEFKKMKNPLIYDLAELNISHYRNSADLENELHMVSVKTLYFPGWEKDQWGDPHIGGALAGPEGCTPVVLEASNKSGNADEMTAKEDRMSVLGSEAISKQGRYVASAATAKISSKAEGSILTTLANSLSDAFSEILTFALSWDGYPDVTAEVVVNNDLYDEQVSGEELSKWMKVWQSGGISFDAYFNMLKKREVYPDNWSQEEEERRISESLSKFMDLPGELYTEVMARISEMSEALNLNESLGVAALLSKKDLEVEGTVQPIEPVEKTVVVDEKEEEEEVLEE